MKFKVTYFENLKYTFSSSHQQKVHQIFDLCNDSINVDGRFSFLFVQGKKVLYQTTRTFWPVLLSLEDPIHYMAR